MQDAISEILAKKITEGQLTAEEQHELEVWLQEPANAGEYAEVMRLWESAGNVKYEMQVDVDAEWNHFKQLTQHSIGRRRFAWVAAMAASVALLIGIFTFRNTTQTDIFKYVSDNAPAMVVLPDSSVVWLNRNSQIAYKYNESKHTRTVALIGEAMFDVRHTGDEFVVKTPQRVYTRVLGTSFNLKALADAKKVDLSVVEGKVAFGSRKVNTVVTKGQSSSFDCNKNIVTPPDSLDNNAIAWHTGVFSYNNKPLSQISTQLGNYLGMKITLPADSRNVNYTGYFDHPTAEQVAEIIATAMNWEYKVNDSEIVFSKR